MYRTAIKSQFLPYLVRVSLLMVLYFGGGKLGLTLSSVEGIVTLVWPPTGIALAALLLFGYQLWPGIALAAFLVNVSAGASPAVALGISVGNTLEAVVGAYLLSRVVGFRNSLERLQDVLSLAGLAAVVSTMVSATIGAASLGLGNLIPWSAYGSTWWVWWLGDALGALVVAPVLLTWGSDFRIERQPRCLIEAATLLVLLVIISQLVFGGWLAPHLANAPLLFALFPFLIWAALRFGQRGAVMATLVETGIAVWSTAHGFGPFVLETIHLSLVFLGGFMGTTALTAMLLAAAIAERRRAEVALSESQDRLAGIVNSAMDAIITVDARQRIILFNTAAEQMFRCPATTVIGQPLDQFIPERFRLIHREHIRAFGQTGVTSRTMGALGTVNGVRAGGEEFPIEAAISQVEAARQKLYTVILRDVTERDRAEAEREKLLAELQAALVKIKTLRGLIPICSSCKKIRDDQGYWTQLEVYIRDHSEAEFSHGICPECAAKLYPDFFGE
jgi:PAS domain S-box-containing protein